MYDCIGNDDLRISSTSEKNDWKEFKIVENLRRNGKMLDRVDEIKNEITKSVFMLKKKIEKSNFLYKLKNQIIKKSDELLDILNKKNVNLDPSLPIKNLKNDIRRCLDENILKKNKALRLRIDTNICNTKEKKLSEKILATEVDDNFLSTLYRKYI
jgi:hypothetical protein